MHQPTDKIAYTTYFATPVMRYVLSCLWDDVYKGTLAANQNE